MEYHGDNKFNIKALETALLTGLLHINEKNEHVGIIEQSVHTIKELTRATYHAIPFKIYTSLIERSLIEVVVDLLNRFLSKDGVSDTLSL